MRTPTVTVILLYRWFASTFDIWPIRELFSCLSNSTQQREREREMHNNEGMVSLGMQKRDTWKQKMVDTIGMMMRKGPCLERQIE